MAVIALNRAAATAMLAVAGTRVVDGAGPLFEQAAMLDAVVALARNWFTPVLGRTRSLP